MPDLANLSLTTSLTLTRCPNLKSETEPPDLSDTPLFPIQVNTLSSDCDSGLWFPTLMPQQVEIITGNEIRVKRRSRNASERPKKASNGKTLDDYVRAWVQKKMESGVPESQCYLPFLFGAPKMVECLTCHKVINPGEQLPCSVPDCRRVYHSSCAKKKHGHSNLKRFKCPQHACYLCNGISVHWRCIQCTIASHNKCAAWPEEVMHVANQPGRAICWRHNNDWQLDSQPAVSTSDIEEIFCRLPLPIVDEEFKIDLMWKGVEKKMDPPPYVHIRRNIYLVKKKRDSSDDGNGCRNCSSTCCENCMCRVQCISCSKACHCSETCTNRPFRKEKKVKIIKTALCGWGVEAAEPINKGEFIVEYIGEVIDDALCEKRLWDMKYKGLTDFYMCEIRKDFTIDATFKGNASRFLNHSCDPNCILEKWQVEGETRVGVFAARSIQVGEPLTYDYRFVQFGQEVRCHCGARNCQGYLGAKRKINYLDICWGVKRKRTSTVCPAVITV